MRLFSKDEVNTGRQVEIDLVKAICILGMIIVHVFEELNVHGANASLGFIDYALVTVADALFGAVTFMFCMGVGLNYSKNMDASKIIKRGIFIFITAYLLNVARSLVGVIITFGTCDLKYALVYMNNYHLNGDIYGFAGLALILHGILKKIKVSNIGITIVSIILFAIASMIGVLNTVPDNLGYFTGLFLPTDTRYICSPENVMMCFPLFLWFFSVAFGHNFGYYLKKCENKNILYIILLIISTIIILPYSIINIKKGRGMFSWDLMDYYFFNYKDAFVCLCGAHFAISLLYFISKILPDIIIRFMTWLSKNIMIIYIIQWIVIGNMSKIVLNINGDIYKNTPFVIVSTIIVIISCILLTKLVVWIIERRKLES